MAKKVFTYRGKTEEELKQMSISEFTELLPTRQRRSIKRGLSDQHKGLLESFNNNQKNIKTHCRNMIIFPQMIGHTVKTYNGKEFQELNITPEMIGHFLGEFALTRKTIKHSSPGVGATRSSASASVR